MIYRCDSVSTRTVARARKHRPLPMACLLSAAGCHHEGMWLELLTAVAVLNLAGAQVCCPINHDRSLNWCRAFFCYLCCANMGIYSGFLGSFLFPCRVWRLLCHVHTIGDFLIAIKVDLGDTWTTRLPLGSRRLRREDKRRQEKKRPRYWNG
ncbi:uncharacterized protein BO95DRAFT_254603 [Aspergillus brunneoviolaceus CBS 621.78]|uniref:Uncharacterized protein n=1 Tax=Aspergillus brunneoviolaceus CBS 621.78 TaxID=1450534 RepID=A0ACD1FY27_9EURO|nr:hypothetical protein BO95DRAFT_254603 [Aspergillus brunneoviolaceus CBS 621.78]RAH41906.1 hypothetical protein BO95DRAFT_254603 [Aspergillus brunneoviolaceus CBS 621.78]